ncbi:MAG TPA: prolyl oligopeptidase family serine peptidase [Opitutaceae bacterium]|nr:prolyl oligopeptidase family serine peptidase [Opitutaceae bacterium]
MKALCFVRVRLLAFALAGICASELISADGPPPPAKRLPPAGIAIAEKDRADLTAGAAALRSELDDLTRALAGNTRMSALLPDVEIVHKAVDWPLRYDEFFDAKQVEVARHLLKVGHERAAQLRAGSAPWAEATGLVIRGYRSKLDGSIQPYALVIPPDWKRTGGPARRLDVVLAGRNEKRTELAFIAEREKGPGEIVPAGGIVLHAYGRFCNATKFAGEVDVFEAMQATRRAYRIDANRIVVRGFSMGGASTWHLAVHFPDTWVAASPGAGFAETAVYTKAFAAGKPERPAWEQKLWRWYDATGYAANLRNVPTIAYSGEIDPQKQSADIMEQAVAAEGLKLERLIGPQTAHKYHPETKATLAARLEEIAAKGRDLWPAEDHLTTFTLRYSSSSRIKIMEMEQPWERADVHVRFTTPQRLEVQTRNVGVFNVALQTADGLKVAIDGQDVTLGEIQPYYWFVKQDGRWVFKDHTYTDERWRKQTRKMPGLSGPVDDAFMEPFLFVRPTGKPLNATVAAWTESELKHATKMWRDLFRGEVQIKDDTAVTEDDIDSKNLILWGDASSNALIVKILASKKLPLGWDAQKLTFRGKTYDAAHHAPILAFPNPLSTQQRYVVLNSGIDFRDEAYGTNALQVPKLPDFAIIDLREKPGPRWPGKIVDAGFFDAAWR